MGHENDSALAGRRPLLETVKRAAYMEAPHANGKCVIAILWDRKLLKGFRERCRHDLALAKVPPSSVLERNAQLAMQNQMQAYFALQHEEHTFCTDVLDMLRVEVPQSVNSQVRHKRG